MAIFVRLSIFFLACWLVFRRMMARMMATEIATIVMIKMAMTIFIPVDQRLLVAWLLIDKHRKEIERNDLAEKCLNANLNLIGKFVPNLC